MSKFSKVLLAEGGGTSTSWAWQQEGRRIKVRTASLHPLYVTQEAASQIITNELLPQLPFRPDKIIFYGAGCGQPQRASKIKDSLQGCFALAKIEIQTDLMAAAHATLPNTKSGLACILGTGTNAGFYDGYELVYTPPGTGFWLGDEGSGGWFGKQIIIDYVRESVPAELGNSLHRFIKKEPQDLLQDLYEAKHPARYAAKLMLWLSENRHNPYSQKLLTRGFNLFVKEYIQPILKHKKFDSIASSKPLNIGFVGSVAFHFQEEVTEALAAVFEEENVSVRFVQAAIDCIPLTM